jgi:hypothetical protein
MNWRKEQKTNRLRFVSSMDKQPEQRESMDTLPWRMLRWLFDVVKSERRDDDHHCRLIYLNK